MVHSPAADSNAGPPPTAGLVSTARSSRTALRRIRDSVMPTTRIRRHPVLRAHCRQRPGTLPVPVHPPVDHERVQHRPPDDQRLPEPPPGLPVEQGQVVGNVEPDHRRPRSPHGGEPVDNLPDRLGRVQPELAGLLGRDPVDGRGGVGDVDLGVDQGRPRVRLDAGHVAGDGGGDDPVRLDIDPGRLGVKAGKRGRGPVGHFIS